MISDRTLLRVSAAVFITGLLALFILSQEPKRIVFIKEINEKMIGEKVSVTGIIENLLVENSLMMQLADENTNEKIKIVMFDPQQGVLDGFHDGDKVAVSGEISIYKGELEIIANKISKSD